MSKKLVLSGVIGIASLSGMDKPPQKRQREDITPIAAIAPANFNDLPAELRIHIIPFLKAPTLLEAIQKIKAYLLTTKTTARFLYDVPFTKALLLELQNHYHVSALEIAQRMGTVASKTIAKEIMDEAEKSWKEYQNYIAGHVRGTYGDFLFRGNYNANLIPSFLDYIHSKYFQKSFKGIAPEYFINWTLFGDADDVKKFTWWIDSGIFRDPTRLRYMWEKILSGNPHTLELAPLLIDAGYDLNLTINVLGVNAAGVATVTPMTLIDAVIAKIALNNTRDEILARISVINLMKVLRLLIKAGAQSKHEIHGP